MIFYKLLLVLNKLSVTANTLDLSSVLFISSS